MLIVGLGNPGKEYALTRHNAGFRVVEALAEKYGFSSAKKKFHGQLLEGEIAGEKLHAIMPETYMNLSGKSVQAAAAFYKIPPEDIIVIYDELDLPLGKIRVKQGGGSGGHNGIKSIDSAIGANYHRIRFGIGHPGRPEMVSDYVLKPFLKPEKETLEQTLAAVVQAFPLMVAGDAQGFMNKVALILNPPKAKENKAGLPRPEGLAMTSSRAKRGDPENKKEKNDGL